MQASGAQSKLSALRVAERPTTTTTTTSGSNPLISAVLRWDCPSVSLFALLYTGRPWLPPLLLSLSSPRVRQLKGLGEKRAKMVWVGIREFGVTGLAESHDNMIEKRKYTTVSSQATANRQQVETKSLRESGRRGTLQEVWESRQTEIKAMCSVGMIKCRGRLALMCCLQKKGSSRLPFDTHVCAPTDPTPTGLKRTASM